MNKIEILKLAAEFEIGDAALAQLRRIDDFLQDEFPEQFSAWHKDYAPADLVIKIIEDLQDRLEIAVVTPLKEAE